MDEKAKEIKNIIIAILSTIGSSCTAGELQNNYYEQTGEDIRTKVKQVSFR